MGEAAGPDQASSGADREDRLQRWPSGGPRSQGLRGSGLRGGCGVGGCARASRTPAAAKRVPEAVLMGGRVDLDAPPGPCP